MRLHGLVLVVAGKGELRPRALADPRGFPLQLEEEGADPVLVHVADVQAQLLTPGHLRPP